MKKVLAIFVSVLMFASLSIGVMGCSKEAPEQEAPAVETPAAPAAPAATDTAPAAEAAPEAAPAAAPAN